MLRGKITLALDRQLVGEALTMWWGRWLNRA
jgi:hypothetical protein